MAKSKSDDIVIDNYDGFLRKGARSNIPDHIQTGHFKLDFVVNHGDEPEKVDLTNAQDYDPSKIGLPMGKLCEFFGEEGSGKSSLAYRIAGYAQKKGYPCAWIDTEHSFSDNLAEINGVNQDELYYADMTNSEDAERTYYAEDVFDYIVQMCKGGIKCIILDSVANLAPKKAMEASAHEMQVADLARLMSKELRKIVNYASKHGVLVIFINQIREKVGVMFGNPETTPGGRSLRFNASLRIRISKCNRKEAEIHVSDESGNVRLIGRKAYVRIVKNRFAKPFTESLLIPIYYEPYFPDIDDIIFDVGYQLKLIRKYKGSYRWSGLDENGRENFLSRIKIENRLDELVSEIMSKALETGTIVPPELSLYKGSSQTHQDLQVVKDESVPKKKRVSRDRKKEDSSSRDTSVA